MHINSALRKSVVPLARVGRPPARLLPSIAERSANKALFASVLIVGLGGGCIPDAFSQGGPGLQFVQIKPEMHVRQRKAIMVAQGKYYFPLALMALGKTPYDAKMVARNAGYLAMLSEMPWDNFADVSAGVSETKALPEILKEPAKFKTAANTYINAASKLLLVSKSGNEPDTKAAIQEMGKACAFCHGAFRAKGPL